MLENKKYFGSILAKPGAEILERGCLFWFHVTSHEKFHNLSLSFPIKHLSEMEAANKSLETRLMRLVILACLFRVR